MANLGRVSPAQLREPVQLLELWRRGVAAGYWPASTSALLRVFTAAHAALARGRDPGALFVWLLTRGVHGATSMDEEAARQQLLDLKGRSRCKSTAYVGPGSTESPVPIGPVIVAVAGRLGVYTGFGKPHVETAPEMLDCRPVSGIRAGDVRGWLSGAPTAELGALAARLAAAGERRAADVLRAVAATRAA